MPRTCLLKPQSPANLPWPTLAEDLGCEIIDSARSTSDGALLLAVLEDGSAPAILRHPGVTVLVPPELPLGAMDSLLFAKCDSAVCRLVLHTPMHHLYATERLGFPAERLELIPWASQLPAPPATAREAGLLALIDFAGAEKGLAARSGLGRSSRVEALSGTDPAARARLLARASVVVIASAEQESGAGTRELLDAMALGAPIVYTRSWGLQHLIVPEVEGIEVAVGDLASLRKESERLLGNPEMAERLGRQAALKHQSTLTARHYLARLRRILAHQDDADSPEFYLIPAHNHVREMAPS